MAHRQVKRFAYSVIHSVLIGALLSANPAFAEDKSFNIPAQPARTAILDFAKQAGVQILASESVLAGRQTKAIKGNIDPREALRQLLDGTGLVIGSDNGAAITLAVAPASSSATVPSESARPVAVEVAEGIVVSASRIDRSGFAAPTPTTMVDAQDFKSRAATNVTQVLFDMPALHPATGGLAIRNPGFTEVNLRNLGRSRTLVLVDGHRYVPTIIDGVVDGNVLPSALVDRVDIVTGGASAAWGSDAVAGVVNFVLKKQIDGFVGNIQYGISGHDDNRQRAASLAWGTDFADGRGQFMIAGEYDKIDKRPRLGDRAWADQHVGFLSPVGSTKLITTFGVTSSAYTEGGFITGGAPSFKPVAALQGIQFGQGGTVLPYDYGTGLRDGTFQVGGSGSWYRDRVLLSSPAERKNIFARVNFDFSDELHGFAEASYFNSLVTPPPGTGSAVQFPNAGPNTTPTILRDNPYIPQAIKTILAANPGIASFQMGRLAGELGYTTFGSDAKSTRTAVGLDGVIAQSWRWKAYFTHGETKYNANVKNLPNALNFIAAVDAVQLVPGGPITCRTGTLISNQAAPGCVPINLFGQGSITEAAKNYIMGDLYFNALYKQDAGNITLQGEPFSTWAGSVSVLGGYEYRKESVNGDSDPVSKQVWTIRPGTPVVGAWQFTNPQPIVGGYSVKEWFGEIVVPLLKDMPFAKSLDLNAGVRQSKYSTSGTTTSTKIGLTYKPFDSLLLRGTKSVDNRAPNLNELYASGQVVLAQIPDPRFVGLTSGTQVTKGNPNLKPEKADTKTFGVVWQPAATGLKASVDYYSIVIKDAISAPTLVDIVNGCYGLNGFAANPTFCNAISYVNGPNSPISNISISGQNFQAIINRGVDYEVSYRMPMSQISKDLPGRLTMRVLANNLLEMTIDDGRTKVNRAGEINNEQNTNGINPLQVGNPKWRWTASATYESGPWTWYGSARYIGSGKYNVLFTSADIDNNDIPSRTYFDASVQYDLPVMNKVRLHLFAKVANLTDKDPPLIVSTFANNVPTSRGFYDVFGRSFVAGVRGEF